MQRRVGVVTPNFPKRWNKLEAVAEKTEVHDDEFAGAARAFVECGGRAHDGQRLNVGTQTVRRSVEISTAAGRTAVIPVKRVIF